MAWSVSVVLTQALPCCLSVPALQQYRHFHKHRCAPPFLSCVCLRFEASARHALSTIIISPIKTSFIRILMQKPCAGTSVGVGFAIPIDTVMRVVPQLISNGKVSRPSLGVQV